MSSEHFEVTQLRKPEQLPVGLEDLKTYLRISYNHDDALLTDLLGVAMEHAEHFLRRSLIDRSYVLTAWDRMPKVVMLPYGPIQCVGRIVLIDHDANERELSPIDYRIVVPGNELCFYRLYPISRMEIYYEAGYGSTHQFVPYGIRHGIMMHVAMLYDKRSGEFTLPSAVRALFQPYKSLI